MQRLVTHCAILIITLGVVSPNAFAQRIAIVARDSANAVILDDVLVSLFDTAAAIVTAARTDRTGRVIMHAPTAGHYALKAQRIGWRPVISDWIRVAPGDSFEVTMKLPRLVVTLNEVT
ncbi:MAG: carboxypeptidase-like regulatory domain-containing protein, partial [Gemmatimonadota bacterium]